MGIKIKKLSIRNFRCIGSLDLDFTDPDGAPLDLVVLAGPNGCGKTSVLEAIRIICDRKDPDDPAIEEVRVADIRHGSKRYEIDVILQSNASPVMKEPLHFAGSIDNAPPAFEIGTDDPSSYKIWLIKLSQMPFGYLTSWRDQKLVASLPISDEKRDGDAVSEEAERLFALQKKCKNLWLYSVMNGLDTTSNPQVRAIIDPLEKVWKIFYPGEMAEFFIRSVDLDDPESDYNLYLRRRDGTEIPVNDLSSGEIEVLTMAGWLTMNDYRGGIVLIDEPEMHMHVQWHRAIIRALRVLLPETQIIVATHSWDILKSVMSYERFTLLREGDPRIAVDSKAVIR
ncbi:AAA family ATPase [bacterium]|nr:AAA family ATPase [bacterium]